MGAMRVAVIPARGGSKRIPMKNLRPFAGRPIIAYSVTAAIESGVFDRVVVSTDSEAVAATAEELGAEAPFLRPAELADDHTPTAPVIAHALQWLAGHGCQAEHACCIYATAPFLRPGDLRRGLEILTEHRVSSVVAVTTFAFPIFRAFTIADDGRLEMLWPEHELTRSNDLPEAFHDAGQFYWLEVESFLREPRLYRPDSLPVVLPRFLVQDIDTPEDWETAERMYLALAAEVGSAPP